MRVDVTTDVLGNLFARIERAPSFSFLLQSQRCTIIHLKGVDLVLSSPLSSILFAFEKVMFAGA